MHGTCHTLYHTIVPRVTMPSCLNPKPGFSKVSHCFLVLTNQRANHTSTICYYTALMHSFIHAVKQYLQINTFALKQSFLLLVSSMMCSTDYVSESFSFSFSLVSILLLLPDMFSFRPPGVMYRATNSNSVSDRRLTKNSSTSM